MSGKKKRPGDNAKDSFFSFFNLSTSSFRLSPRTGITGSATILEPELHLPGLQAKPFAESQPLLFTRMKTLLEQCFKFLDLLKSVSVVSLLSWWVVSSNLIIPGNVVHVISSRSALMLIFSLKLAASSSYNSLSLSQNLLTSLRAETSPTKRRRRSPRVPKEETEKEKKKKNKMQTYGASFSYVNPWAMNKSINMIWMNPYTW